MQSPDLVSPAWKIVYILEKSSVLQLAKNEISNWLSTFRFIDLLHDILKLHWFTDKITNWKKTLGVISSQTNYNEIRKEHIFFKKWGQVGWWSTMPITSSTTFTVPTSWTTIVADVTEMTVHLLQKGGPNPPVSFTSTSITTCSFQRQQHIGEFWVSKKFSHQHQCPRVLVQVRGPHTAKALDDKWVSVERQCIALHHSVTCS